MGRSKVIRAAPWSDHDPYTDEALLNPWPGYKQLRDAGLAVGLPQYQMFALTRNGDGPSCFGWWLAVE